MISKQTYCVCSMIFFTLKIFHHARAGRFFRCWRRRRGLNNHLISGPLQTSVCCIKHLPVEALLGAHQPEEQHGFRKHRRMDEHLLTATLFLEKVWDKGIPVWIVSLDLSKAFDRANWNALWLAYVITAFLTI